MKKEIAFLKELTDLRATSGNEGSVREFLRKAYEPVADKTETDGLGSLIAYHGEKGPKILAAGHMDEVGFMVRSITKDGFVRFSRCGFFFVCGALSQHFTIETEKGDVDAICSLGPGMEDKEFPKIEDLALDIGCKSEEEARELGVRVGDFIVPKGHFEALGKDGKYLVNKAWDNRIGCAVALRVMENLKKTGHRNIFIGAGTVQEEVGTRGAATLAEAVKPDIAFSVDIGTADDVCGGKKEEASLGKGPELTFMDNMTISNRKLIRFAVEVAEECGIPYQTSIMKRGGTDASKFQFANAGTPVLLVNIPCRYAHTPTTMIHYDDYVNAIKLMTEIVLRLDEKKVKEIRSF